MNDTILLSIKPEFATAILNGTKQFEFRTRRPKNDIKHIIIYSTAPVKAVVGEADVDYVLEDIPSYIWTNCKATGGISKEKYFDYFRGKTTAVAYHLINAEKYDNLRSLSEFGLSCPPQSYAYLQR